MRRLAAHLALAGALAAALAACSPRQACLSAATRELGRIDALVASSEQALALGYRTERAVRPRATVGIGACAGGRVSLCTGTRLGTDLERRAIDPEAERRTLANLRSRQSVLRRQAAAAAQACPAA